MEAYFLLCRNEGIIPAIGANGLAYALKYAKEHKDGTNNSRTSRTKYGDIDYIYEHYGYGERSFNSTENKKTEIL